MISLAKHISFILIDISKMIRHILMLIQFSNAVSFRKKTIESMGESEGYTYSIDYTVGTSGSYNLKGPFFASSFDTKSPAYRGSVVGKMVRIYNTAELDIQDQDFSYLDAYPPTGEYRHGPTYCETNPEICDSLSGDKFISSQVTDRFKDVFYVEGVLGVLFTFFLVYVTKVIVADVSKKYREQSREQPQEQESRCACCRRVKNIMDDDFEKKVKLPAKIMQFFAFTPLNIFFSLMKMIFFSSMYLTAMEYFTNTRMHNEYVAFTVMGNPDWIFMISRFGRDIPWIIFVMIFFSFVESVVKRLGLFMYDIGCGVSIVLPIAVFMIWTALWLGCIAPLYKIAPIVFETRGVSFSELLSQALDMISRMKTLSLSVDIDIDSIYTIIGWGVFNEFVYMIATSFFDVLETGVAFWNMCTRTGNKTQAPSASAEFSMSEYIAKKRQTFV